MNYYLRSKMLPNVIWRAPESRVYLTFDDGPDSNVTPRLLDLLQAHQISATFFLIGQKVAQSPEIVSRIQREGHSVGNHSFTHPRMIGKSKAFLLKEIRRTDESIANVTGKKPSLFRPPYGLFGMKLLRLLPLTEHRMVLWSISALDYRPRTSPNNLKIRLLKLTTPREIIVLHDGHRNGMKTLEALANTLPVWKRRGFIFSSIPETWSAP
ncbi:polysaccharide deacetylase family protein, partial [candidate division KSB1 bacterium]|nr:polysaccharide deacetylase family protein [candidate division KSB1 bacterium]NIR73266.1 polysaccharide deacetylase family protein [candidate division KSB1 bacterium]NIS26972.1 polysaccharide deacetylase family protein [candidate division KSB1 bacterium]NIT73811.1 polysaccharide deacetylase family protein [candidate division KSB1 bacterium]NIU27716.1 polysaccharide deacetylase family protein [candidate division KSB1 bacterium]